MKYVVLDTETTSVDVFNDRIVTAFLGLWDTDKEKFDAYMEFLVNPGIPIPAEATAVHGITDEMAANGMEPEEFLELIFYMLQDWAEYPLVAYNANFDLSILNAELERYGYPAFDFASKRQIIDPLVLERHYNKYVRGKKRLIDIVGQRGIPFDEDRLHDASYDSEMTARVVAQQIEQWGIPTNEEQAKMHAAWAESFEKFLRNAKGDDSIVVERDWPVRVKEEA